MQSLPSLQFFTVSQLMLLPKLILTSFTDIEYGSPPYLCPGPRWARNEETPSMLTLKKLLWSLLMLAIAAVPVMAGDTDGKVASANATNATDAAAVPANPNPAPNLTSPSGSANVTALLGLLVMKGVL